MTILGAELPSFAQAARDLTRLCPNVEVGTSQLEGLTEAAGRYLEGELLAEVEAAWREPYELRALPEVDGYHEVRTGAVAGCEPVGGRRGW